MLPIVTPAEMQEIDRCAPDPLDVLIARAGGAVARTALTMLGGAYGRRVAVLAGDGNNGADGRDAARRLRARGAHVIELPARALPEVVPPCDLVIDAAFGTGFHGTWRAPVTPEGARVLAVDIPSGVLGIDGSIDASSHVLPADVTVTFAALKPGLVLQPGRSMAGEVVVADIGLDVGGASAHVVTDADVVEWWPARPVDDHKWRSAVWAVGGSDGMTGAVALTSAGAQRTGAGYVRCSVPQGVTPTGLPPETVGTALPAAGWGAEVAAGLGRFSALVIGNGMGRDPASAAELRVALAGSQVPVVVDADALVLLGRSAAEVVSPLAVLTPHDGEVEALVGRRPGPDRLGAARQLADELGAVVLLKGGPTVVAHPDGRLLVVASGDARLATAGTGDVLAGMVAAVCARGLDPFRAAAVAAHLHGRAGALGWRTGLTAGDLPDLVPAALDAMGVAGLG